MEAVFMKGIRLRGYDAPTETPVDYREFDVVDEPEEPRQGPRPGVGGRTPKT